MRALLPPASPRFSGSAISCSSGKRRRIVSIELSREPLSTTRTEAPPRSASRRLSRHATVSAARFQLRTTMVTWSAVTTGGSPEPEPLERQRPAEDAVAEPAQVLDELRRPLGAMRRADVDRQLPQQAMRQAERLPEAEGRAPERSVGHRRRGCGEAVEAKGAPVRPEAEHQVLFPVHDDGEQGERNGVEAREGELGPAPDRAVPAHE